MAAGHPKGLADLFLDRSLGRRQVPEMLRGAGLRLHTCGASGHAPMRQQGSALSAPPA